MNTIKIIEKQKLTWINITRPDAKEIGFLASNFNFLENDLKDCEPLLQRPKLLEREGYLFMILQFPVYNRETGKINASEVDFFILPDKLITVHDNKIAIIDQFFYACLHDKNDQRHLFDESPIKLLIELLNELLRSRFPMLNHINWDIDAVENKIFSDFSKETISVILNTKRNIVYFRKSMQEHKNVLKKLSQQTRQIAPKDDFGQKFDALIEHTKEIWDLLENYKESIDALYETFESLTNFRLSNIMKTLTIFSVIVFPLTLLAAIFGMNVAGGMPFLRHPYGFWGVIGIMIIGSISMFVYFKKKRWI